MILFIVLLGILVFVGVRIMVFDGWKVVLWVSMILVLGISVRGGLLVFYWDLCVKRRNLLFLLMVLFG